MMKKIASITIGCSMVLMAAVPAFAVSNTCQNLTTGFLSNNTCNILLTKLKALSLSNTARVDHNIFKTVTTGNNGVYNNTSTTGNLAIDTGVGNASVDSLAVVNTNSVTVNQTDSMADNIGTNNITGANSNNTVTVNTTKNITLNITNDGTVNHTANIIVNTGGNVVSNNTVVGGGIRTGAATSNVSIQTILNSNTVIINQ